MLSETFTEDQSIESAVNYISVAPAIIALTARKSQICLFGYQGRKKQPIQK